MASLDARGIRSMNALSQNDQHLNFLQEGSEIPTRIMQQGQGVLPFQHHGVGQLNLAPFIYMNNQMLQNQNVFDMQNINGNGCGSSHNLQPPIAMQHPLSGFQSMTPPNIEMEQVNPLLNIFLQNNNRQPSQMLLNQVLLQQQQLAQQQQMQLNQNNNQFNKEMNNNSNGQPQQALSQQYQQQLLTHLAMLNNPMLIQQLYNTVTNPIENARFAATLLRLNQQATVMTLPQQMNLQSLQSLQAFQQMPIGLGTHQSSMNMPILAPSSGAVSSSSPQQVNLSQQNLQQKLIQQQKQKEELTRMLEFLVEKMHQTDTDMIFEKKHEFKYLQGEDLAIFDNIVHKYQFSKKTKEEMVKYILRKCFKFLKGNIKQQEIVGQKDIELAFTRKYFGNEIGSQQQLQIQKQFLTSDNHLGLARQERDSDDSADNLDDCKVKEEPSDHKTTNSSQPHNQVNLLTSSKNLSISTNNLDSDDLIEKVMPFKQGSKIKTMNIQFLKMIFRSDLFIKDYQQYLEKFEELAQKENQKKIQKCVKNLQDFIERGQINKVKSYKRLPWLNIWLKDTYELAKTLSAYGDEAFSPHVNNSQENIKEGDLLTSQFDLKKKLRTPDSVQNLPKIIGGEESQPMEQIAVSPSCEYHAELESVSPMSRQNRQEHSPQKIKSTVDKIIQGHRPQEVCQNFDHNMKQQQIISGEWRTPDTIKKSPYCPKENNHEHKEIHSPVPEIIQGDHDDDQNQEFVKHEELEQIIPHPLLNEQSTLNKFTSI